MTTEPEDIDEGELPAEQEVPVEVGPGCFCFRDWDFLDPENEVQGIIGVQVDGSGGVWLLVGVGEGPTYRQEWHKVGGEPKRPTLSRVQ